MIEKQKEEQPIEKITTSKMSKDGKVTIPKEIRQMVGMKKDGRDIVEWYIEETEKGKQVVIQFAREVHRTQKIE